MKTENPIPDKPAVRLTGGYVQALIPMSDFVLQEYTKLNAYYYQENKVLKKIHDYAKFLKQPLTLGMFVPCDLEGLILAKPSDEAYENCLDNVIYREAKSRVIFEEFEIKEYPDAEPDEITKVIKFKNCYAFHFKDNQWNLGIALKTIEDLIPDGLSIKSAACT